MRRVIAAVAMMTMVAGSAAATDLKVLGGRPRGCPPQACGCVASLKVFGRITPRLNLAENWVRDFQRAAPAPMMAAARRGHVFILLYHVAGDVWHVHDGNTGNRRTGRHKIIEHDRSIRGFKIIDPHRPKRTMRP